MHSTSALRAPPRRDDGRTSQHDVVLAVDDIAWFSAAAMEAAAAARDVRTLFGAAREAAGRESTELATLAVGTTRLGSAVELQPEAALERRPAALGARIVSNLDVTIAITAGSPAALDPRVDDVLGQSLAPWQRSRRPGEPEADDASPALTDTVLVALLEVHAAVVRVAAALTDRRDAPA